MKGADRNLSCCSFQWTRIAEWGHAQEHKSTGITSALFFLSLLSACDLAPNAPLPVRQISRDISAPRATQNLPQHPRIIEFSVKELGAAGGTRHPLLETWLLLVYPPRSLERSLCLRGTDLPFPDAPTEPRQTRFWGFLVLWIEIFFQLTKYPRVAPL